MKKAISAILKLIVVVFATTGTALCLGAGSEDFMGGANTLMYFTIQSNIALALISAAGLYFLLRRKAVPQWWYVVRFMGTISITLTGAVFCFVLAPTLGSWAWGRVNVYTHVIVPIAAVVDFFVSCVDANLQKKHVVFTLLPPIAYAIFAGIGYAARWEFSPGVNYPYFFLNWGSPAGAFGFSNQLPFMGCVWWIALLTVLLTGVALGYLAILKAVRK